MVTEVLTSTLTTSFTALGATRADALAAVGQISGAGTASSSASSQLPDAVREKFLDAVAQGYADSVAWAFGGMAIAMLVVVVLGILYPRGHVSARARVDLVPATAATGAADDAPDAATV